MKNPNRGGSSSTPTHFYVDDAAYFITAATYRHQRLLDDTLKDRLQDLLHQVYAEFAWQLQHWVILDDHYHLLANSRCGRDLPRIIGKVHSLSARLINQRQPPESREHSQVWCNYWDYCPRDEREYNLRLCYLLYNPIKHGYVERLGDWRWSSFAALLAAEGEQALRGVFREHREFHELELPADVD
ncbi:MAG: transposase [Chromatiales bacterium]|jgi:putative transposase